MLTLLLMSGADAAPVQKIKETEHSIQWRRGALHKSNTGGFKALDLFLTNTKHPNLAFICSEQTPLHRYLRT